MPAAPRPPAELHRLSALRAYHILDTLAEPEFDDITRLAAQICRTPTALITLIDDNRQWFKSRCAFPTQETARELAFCAYTILEQGALVVPDATQDARFADNPLVTGEPHIRFYAGTPLLTPAGLAIGSLAVIDYAPRQLTEEQLEALLALNRQVVAQLELRKRVDEERRMHISGRRRALREFGLQKSALLESALDSVVMITGEGRILEFNPSAERTFGMPRTDAVGRDFAELILPVPSRELYRRDMTRFLATGQSSLLNRRVETIAQRADGTALSVELSVTRLGESEPPIFGAFIRDITDAKRAKEVLRESEERYRSLVETSNDLVFAVDADGRITYVNQAARVLCGRAPEEMIGRPFQDFVTQDRRARDVATFAEAMETGRDVMEYTTRMLHADGSVVTIRANARVLRDADGRFIGSTGTARDITQSTRAEEALRHSSERLELVGRATNDAVWDWDLIHSTVWWNENFYTLFGYRAGEIEVGPASWTNRLHPADKHRVEEGLRTVLKGDQPDWEAEYRFRCADGSYAEIFDRGHVLRDSGGKAVRMIGAMMDVTARKDAEERFHQIASRIGEVFWLTDVEKRTVLYVSPAYEAIWGRSASSLYAAAHSWLEAVHPDDRDRVAWAAQHEQEQGRYDIEYRITRPDGAERWIHDRAFPVSDEAGNVYRIAGVASDITNHKLAEDRARLSEEQFRHSQKMEAIGSLAGGIAHDFNNILTVIVSYTEMMLANAALDGPLRCDAREIRVAADRAAALTRQLLAFSRKQVLRPTVLSINAVVESMHGMLSRVIREDIRLEIRLGSEVHPIRVDQGQLEQVIMNLVVNARDAMPEGGQLVIETANVELERPDADRDTETIEEQVVLTVTDSGTGIDAVTRDRLFEPFFTTKEVGKGTGLGLSTVYGIVQQSGGSIGVSSEPGHGTTFHVQFPRARGATDIENRISGEQAVTAPPQATVLVVEDDPAVRAAVRVMLERIGYRVFEVPDASAALDAMRTGTTPFDAVLSDAMMPGMSGLDLADAILSEHAHVPVLIMSGYSEDAIVRGGQLRPRVLFVEKPFTVHALSLALARAIALGSDGREGDASSRPPTAPESPAVQSPYLR